MAKSNLHITSENITEWMASTGFLFPRTMLELERFEKLYGDVQEDLTGCQIDPEIILGRKERNPTVTLTSKIETQEVKFRMAARKGEGSVPNHIMDKIKQNQDKRKLDDSGSAQEGTK